MYDESGFDSEYDSLDGMIEAGGSYTLDVINAAEHAVYIQNMEGRYVFDDEHLVETTEAKMEGVVEYHGAGLNRDVIRRGLSASGHTEVNHLQSLTAGTTSGINRGDGPRRLHPGNWADRTGQLNRSYHIEVDGVPA